MRMLAVLLPCALFSSGATAEFFESGRAPTVPYYPDCMGLHGAALHHCIAAELERTAPCKGTLEERLNCLEAKIAQQDSEMQRLKWKFQRSRDPRIQPLDQRLSLE